MNITDSFALFQFLWLAVYENRRKAISGSSYYIANSPIRHRIAVVMENTATTLVSDQPPNSKW